MFDSVDTLVCLIGEQPVPNLLAIRQFKPSKLFLVFSEKTKSVADNLLPLLDSKVKATCIKVKNPFDLKACIAALVDGLKDLPQPAAPDSSCFNITGGTKPMSLAAFTIAQQRRGLVVYLESQGSQPTFYCYSFSDPSVESSGSPKSVIASGGQLECSVTVSIADYLAAHGIRARERESEQTNPFEGAVSELISKACCDVPEFETARNAWISENVELDLIVRNGNKFAVAEIKSGRSAAKKAAIDQLVSATQPDRLGTYTKRILIVDRNLDNNNSALAQASGITVVEVNGWDAERGMWESKSCEDEALKMLRCKLCNVFNLQSPAHENNAPASGVK